MARTTPVNHGKEAPLYNEGHSPQNFHMAPELFDKEQDMGSNTNGKELNEAGNVEVWVPTGKELTESPQQRKRRHLDEELARKAAIRSKLEELKGE